MARGAGSPPCSRSYSFRGVAPMCALCSSARAPTSVRRFTRGLASLALPLLLGALGCRDMATDLTQPEVPAPDVAAAAAVTYEQIASSLHTCGITAGFQTYCWGYNGGGILGDGTNTDRPTPVRVATG